jgi:diadenosine tetraphosphate (Ap4A) HIT family hydrolase
MDSPENSIVDQGEHWYIRTDNFPVGVGHVNIVTKWHVASLYEVTKAEWDELQSNLVRAKNHIEIMHSPNGYNIGINDGLFAGQTIMHLHIHLIPRYAGDVDNPRGGIRNFKPALRPY